MYPYAVILPAAGSGSRMGVSLPKVLLPIHRVGAPDRSVLRYTIEAFLGDPNCLRVIVCVPASHMQRFGEELPADPRVEIIEGGPTRQASVSLGVSAMREAISGADETITLVHDAARACVSFAVIQRVVAAVAEHGAATAAVPVVDSVCRGAGDGSILEYVDRNALWSIQTPQGFFLGELFAAHQRARELGIEALDDASLMSSVRRVALVEGDRLNIKITLQDDLRVASLVRGAMEN